MTSDQNPHTPPLPVLDPAALHWADVAYVFTPGTDATKVRAAIEAYLWAVEHTGSTGPSLEQWRAAKGLD